MIMRKSHIANKPAVILAVLIVAISLLAACGSKMYDGSSQNAQYMTAPSSAPGGGNMGSYDSYDVYGEVYYMEKGEEMYAPEAAPVPAPDAPMSSVDNSGAANAAAIAETSIMAEKIIYTAYADVETVEFDDTIERVYDMLGIYNAFIEDSYVGGRNYAQTYYGYQTYRTARFTIRVPKDLFGTVTSNLDSLGNVTSLSTNAENITAQFYDTESRLNSYRIQEERLLAMLEKADTVTDMISIEARLAEVRYSIESLTSTLKNWQSQVDYSTLTLFVTEVEKFTESVPIQRTYWQQIGDGLQATTRGVGEFFTKLFKLIIILLPVLVVLAVIAIVVLVIVRRSIRKRKNSGDK